MKKRCEDELFDKLSEIDGDLIDEAHRIDNAEKLKRYAAKERGGTAVRKHLPTMVLPCWKLQNFRENPMKESQRRFM